MDFNKLNFQLTAKIFLLAVFIIPVSLQAQEIQFDLIQGENKIKSFEVVSYKNDKAKVLKSKAGKIIIDKSVVLQSDSIFITHSFYKNVLDLKRIKEKTYFIEEAMELESIVLKSPEIFIKKDKGRKVDGLCSFCRESISIPTENLKNKTIKGIELYFSFLDNILKNEKICVLILKKRQHLFRRSELFAGCGNMRGTNSTR